MLIINTASYSNIPVCNTYYVYTLLKSNKSLSSAILNYMIKHI